MKVVIRVKGGEGSGFYGHSGRPGLVGGSSPAGSSEFELLNTAHQLPPHNPAIPGGTSYFILPNNKILNAEPYGGHYEFFFKKVANNQSGMKLVGVNPSDVPDEFKGSIDSLIPRALKSGTIRVNYHSRFGVQVETLSINTETLRRVQKLIDDDKILIPYNGDIVWSSFDTDKYIRTRYEDFMTAKYIKDGVLKEYM